MEIVKRIVYQALDLLTMKRGVRKRISGFDVRLPVRFHSYFPPNYEYDNFRYLETNCKKGDTVIDIGAHIGLFSIRAAQVVGEAGRVYAFEPTPKTYRLLQHTIRINNKQDCVIPRKEAVAEKEGLTQFHISDLDGDNSNSLVEYRYDKHLQKVDVRLVSIDSFIEEQKIQHLDFLKIDAEGYEYFVLLGARQTFMSKRPKGILALHPSGIKANGNDLNSIYRFLKEVGYCMFYDGKFLTENEFCAYTILFDVFLIPEEKSVNFVSA